jgi:LuxR family maltose regulon positive regulatory protein
VPRPRLIERLNAGLDRKLTLISAPAGFGKTTLLSEWIHRKGVVTAPLHVAWLSLDEGDNDPAHFFAYFIAAIQTIHQDIGQSVVAASQPSQPLPIQALLTTLINEIAPMPERFALVLDDYHFVTAQPIHDGLTFLLDHLPPQLHLVIATRADPPLPLARLRARGQLTELRQSDLRFTTDEAAAFLNRVMGLNLSPDHVTALESRTETRAACQSPLTIAS